MVFDIQIVIEKLTDKSGNISMEVPTQFCSYNEQATSF